MTRTLEHPAYPFSTDFLASFFNKQFSAHLLHIFLYISLFLKG
jgi:hypothetical protein